jgi:prevent-host-death family protein
MIATVRMAKAHLSSLLERAAAGEEITITSDGRPKAKIVGLAAPKAYRVERRLWRRTGATRGKPAEKIVREDRDARD